MQNLLWYAPCRLHIWLEDGWENPFSSTLAIVAVRTAELDALQKTRGCTRTCKTYVHTYVPSISPAAGITAFTVHLLGLEVCKPRRCTIESSL